jgi:hypothetical protein
MSAPSDNPLSNAEMEILRALLCGVELRDIGGEWRFVGQWQDRRFSRADRGIVARLLRSGLISVGEDFRVELTPIGEKTLSQYLEEVTSTALNYRSGRECVQRTYAPNSPRPSSFGGRRHERAT